MTVQPPAERPAPGYYPDPSIPGFVRYWDGDAWTPGSARPAPESGAPLPPPPRAARGGVRVAPPPPPRPATPEETGPVFLDETGAAQLIVPPAPDLPDFPRPPSVYADPPASVWAANPQAQPGLLDTGPVPHHVSWGVPPTPPGDVDPDEELASALRLALSQTRRAQLPSPDHYTSTPEPSRTPPPGAGGWPPPTPPAADPAPPLDPRATPAPPSAAPDESTTGWAPPAPHPAAHPTPTAWSPRADRAPGREPWSSDGASGAGVVEDAGGWARPTSRPAAQPAARTDAPAAAWSPRADRAPDREPWSSDGAPGAGVVEDAGGWARPTSRPAAQPAARTDAPAAAWTPRADRAPDREPWSSDGAPAESAAHTDVEPAVWTLRADRAPDREPWSSGAPSARAAAAPGAVEGADGRALPATRPAARPAVPDGASARQARSAAASGVAEDAGGSALPAARAAAQPAAGVGAERSVASPANRAPAGEASGASRVARAEGATSVGAKAQRRGKGKAARPALLGPRIGARLVDTVVTYALVGVLAVALVQRVTLHLQAKIDAAQASGVPQTVWLVDGTVLANAGLLLAALLAVGLVYETIPLAVWGRTLGKAMFGLTVLDARSKARPRLGRTFLRTAMCQTLVFLLLGILELVPCATDRKLRQSWHDKLGATFVAKQRG